MLQDSLSEHSQEPSPPPTPIPDAAHEYGRRPFPFLFLVGAIPGSVLMSSWLVRSEALEGSKPNRAPSGRGWWGPGAQVAGGRTGTRNRSLL